MPLDQSLYRNRHSLKNKLGRLLWGLVWGLFFRPTPRFFHGWRVFLLKIFGAKIGQGVHVYPSCRIWAPWNLVMGDHSCLSFDVDCYSVDKVVLGERVTVSQYSYLCTASHDISDPHMELTTAPILIGDRGWVAAGAFVGPGITLGEGAVVGAYAVVTKDVPPWTVVAGNPARPIKQRVLQGKTN